MTVRTSSLLFGADALGWGQSPLRVLLSARGHLDAHFHWDRASDQFQRPGPGRDVQTHDPAALAGLGEGAQAAAGTTAHAPLVFDENQDVAQREVGLALAAGQQVVLFGPRPPRAGGGGLWRLRSGPGIMVGFGCGKKKAAIVNRGERRVRTF